MIRSTIETVIAHARRPRLGAGPSAPAGVACAALLAAARRGVDGSPSPSRTPPTPRHPRTSRGRKPAATPTSTSAFASARAQSKPVLLYWGAVWCPPCNQLKATLFKRQDFAERSKSFVAVHLDGDAAGAQKLGTRFKVVGYPTLILFSPDRKELTRLPGEADARAGRAGAAARHGQSGRPVALVLADVARRQGLDRRRVAIAGVLFVGHGRAGALVPAGLYLRRCCASCAARLPGPPRPRPALRR